MEFKIEDILRIDEDFFRSVPVEMRRSSDDKRTVVKINTRERDTYNTVIEPQGLDVTRYMKNPVVLINHREDLPVTRTSVLKLDGDSWIAIVEDSDWDLDDPEALRWFKKIKSGLVRGASIRFFPKEVKRDDTNPNDVYYRITKSELLEWSYVTVQSNPSTLVMQRAVQRHANEDLLKRIDAIVTNIDTIKSAYDSKFNDMNSTIKTIRSSVYNVAEEILARLEDVVRKEPPASATQDVNHTSNVDPAVRSVFWDELVNTLLSRLDKTIDRKLGRS